MFQAQLNTMVMWFDQWSESGQTVALFKMLTRLAPTQARFVSIALEHSLTECAELALREQEANNPGFVSGLLSETEEVAMTQTLIHLPLLRPGNSETRAIYLALVPALLAYSMETGTLVEEARQLLSYVLIHPALREDRRIFEPWRRSLGEKIMAGTSKPPATPNTEWSSQDDLSSVGAGSVPGKARRFSLSSEQPAVPPPLSPQSSQASSGSGSETHLDLAGDLTPHMRDVKNWLKSLRLHKYWHLLCQLSYEQILSLTEENFDSVLDTIGGGQVTQGARRKIILSIVKLRERAVLLDSLEQDVMNGGHLLTAMDELKQILATPIKAYHEEEHPSYDDIPSRFTRVLGKICTQLMVGGRGWGGGGTASNSGVDEHASWVFLGLLETTLHHDAFSQQQKKRINSWCLQIGQILRRAEDSGRTMSSKVVLTPPPLSLSPRPQPALNLFKSRNDPVIGVCRGGDIRSSRSTEIVNSSSDMGNGGAETEIDSRLESLCLSMTEHALGSPSDNEDKRYKACTHN
uniref:Putative rna-binding protein involved in translational regulation n=1 Tax=Panstrongylus lignarius TaxID=156445 RepID=A0A224XLQ0_9HEMI